MPFLSGCNGGSAACHESTARPGDGKGGGSSRDIGQRYGTSQAFVTRPQFVAELGACWTSTTRRSAAPPRRRHAGCLLGGQPLALRSLAAAGRRPASGAPARVWGRARVLPAWDPSFLHRLQGTGPGHGRPRYRLGGPGSPRRPRSRRPGGGCEPGHRPGKASGRRASLRYRLVKRPRLPARCR